MFFKKKNPIGLDIGSGYIKAVHLNETKEGYELSFVGVQPLAHELIIEGTITDKKSLAAAVRDVLKTAGGMRGEAVVGVSGHSAVIVKKIVMPLMTHDELGLSIKYEAEQYIPFDINDVNIDFAVLGPRPDEEGQMDVLLIAAKKTVVADYEEVVESAGLKPVIVDVDAFALSNMYELNYDGAGKKNLALINVGAGKTNMNILNEGRPVFMRDSAIGSNHHSEMLERVLDVSREDAERLKLGQSVAGVPADKAHSVLANASDEICMEISRSFEYFRSSISEEDVSEILLSGGAALMKGFPEMLAEKLGMQVEVANPFRKIKIPERLDPSHIMKIAPIAAVAVGLALRRGGDMQ